MAVRLRRGNLLDVGVQGNAGQANYAASKAGIIGGPRAGARGRPVGRSGQRRRPGLRPHPLTDVLSDEQRERLLAATPLGRLGTPRTSPGPSPSLLAGRRFITGAVLAVDGACACERDRGRGGTAAAWS